MLQLFKSNIHLMVLIIGAITLTSCEGNTRRYLTVENSSSESINVIYNDFNMHFDTLTIDPNTKTDLLFLSDRGGQSNSGSPSTYILDMVIYKGLDSCIKNNQLDDNWNITSEKTKRVPSHWEHHYTFDVLDSDF